MSLINDALRRAKQAQQDTPPPLAAPSPHFRPVEPSAPASRYGIGVLLPISLASAALLGLVLLWGISRRDGSPLRVQGKSPLSVAARTIPSSDSVTAAANPNSPSGTVVAVANPSAAAKAATVNTPQSPTIGPDHFTSGHPADTSASPGTSLSSSSSATADTTHPAAVEPLPSAPPPLKLQGIVFNPRRPSALINGRVMFVGDHIQDFRLTGIHPGDVVLIGANRTNLLSLEP